MTYTIPISVKGVVLEDGKIWLRQNERQEWEIPGGKLEQGEQPEQTVVRELKEECGFEVEVVRILDAHVYVVENSYDESNGVVVISYLCSLRGKSGAFEVNGEAGAARFQRFSMSEIQQLQMPDFYKQVIHTAVETST